jgi:hypothetical protein
MVVIPVSMQGKVSMYAPVDDLYLRVVCVCVRARWPWVVSIGVAAGLRIINNLWAVTQSWRRGSRRRVIRDEIGSSYKDVVDCDRGAALLN